MALRDRFKQWLYNSCPGFAGSFPYQGVKVYFPKDSIVFKMATQSGVYERENTKLVGLLIKPNTTYFDVGGNIGLMAIPVLGRCSSCQVVSFEPSPNNLPYLRKTVNESRFKDRWTIVEKAVGAETGTVTFFASAPESGAYDSLREVPSGGAKRQITVPLTTLDAEWERLNRPTVSLIKIDVEGGEMHAFRGAAKMIQRDKPRILAEWSVNMLCHHQVLPEALLDWAKEMDYRIYSLPYFTPLEDMLSLSLSSLRFGEVLLVPKSDYFTKDYAR